MRYLLFLTLVLLGMGCASSGPATEPEGTTIVVEGTLSMRGNEPFTALVLETAERNTYVLNVDDMQQEVLDYGTPVRARVSGILYQDTWNGQPYAHLRVTSILDLAIVPSN